MQYANEIIPFRAQAIQEHMKSHVSVALLGLAPSNPSIRFHSFTISLCTHRIELTHYDEEKLPARMCHFILKIH